MSVATIRRPPFPRTRTRSSIVQVPFFRYQVTFGGTTTASACSSGVRGVREIMDDVVTPGYKGLQAAGHVINNPCTKMREEFGLTGGGYSHSFIGPPTLEMPLDQHQMVRDRFDNLLIWKLGQQTSRWNSVERTLVLSTITSDDIDRLVTLAATRALSNYNKSYAQGLVFLGELGETLNLLRNPLAALIKYLSKPWRTTQNKKYLGKGKVARYRVLDPVAEIIPLGDAAASQYLAWYYGLRPIMKDIEDAVEAIKKLYKVRQKTSAMETKSGGSSVQSALHNGSALQSCSYLHKVGETVEVTCGLLFQPQVMTADRAFGVSLNAVPSAVFELIPWSFTTSWISNLGTFVNALAVMHSSDIRAEWCVVRKKMRIDRFCLPGTFVINPAWTSSLSTDGDWYTAEEYTRFPINLAQRAGVVFKSPDLDFPQSLAAASLAIQQLVGKAHSLLKG